jgi:hypothetical protein
MPRTGARHLTNAVNITVAFPRHAAKEIARAVGCTHSQAERITKTGYIPERLLESTVQILERALDAWEEKIRQERQNLKAIRVRRMAARAEDRRDDSSRAPASMAGEPYEEPEQLALIGEGE